MSAWPPRRCCGSSSRLPARSAPWSRTGQATTASTRSSTRAPTMPVDRPELRGLRPRLPPHREQAGTRASAEPRRAAPRRAAGVQHVATIQGTREARRVRACSPRTSTRGTARSGATDNGTGTITMLEAMRILKQVYPNPKRTILVGHWSGEEQGLNRLARVRRGSSRGREGTCRRCSTRTTAPGAS